ncbi:MAG TPA: hypothetical protein VLC49_05835 [Solirubrobacteraceae bacterium]|nr:hypothetical protein [Solirubrobacteraceae bacterium]
MNASRTTVEHVLEPPERATASSDATTFDVNRQSAQNISNVGGDQTIYYGDRGRASRAGKLLAALGLSLSLAGLALLVVFGVMTAHSVLQAANNGGVEKPYTQYLPSAWPAAIGLILSGFVVNRVARIVVGR